MKYHTNIWPIPGHKWGANILSGFDLIEEEIFSTWEEARAWVEDMYEKYGFDPQAANNPALRKKEPKI